MFSLFVTPIIAVLKIAILVWIAFRIVNYVYAYYTNNRITVKRELLLLLLAVYVSSVLAVTVAPAFILEFNDPNAIRLNLLPVVNTLTYYLQALHNHDEDAALHAMENIIGNLILLIPLGILVPCIFKSCRSLKSVFTICVVSSFSIEIIQFFLWEIGTFRTVDIDDLILNSIGGMLGWFIYEKLIRRYFPVLILQ